VICKFLKKEYSILKQRVEQKSSLSVMFYAGLEGNGDIKVQHQSNVCVHAIDQTTYI
jgi:hypothetical protein